MNSNAEKLLSDLYLQYQNLTEISKNEKDVKNLKSLEKEMNTINSLTRALTSYINYYKLKNAKK